MAVNNTINLSGTTETTTTRPATIGQFREEQDVVYGYRLCRPVQNTSGVSIGAGLCVAFTSGSNTAVALAASGALKQTIAGVTIVAIPNGSWGWVVCAGSVAAVSGAAIAANARVRPIAAAGQFDDAAVVAAEDEFIGLALTLTAGSGVSFTLRVSGLV
jgi:hypothetical protein